MSEGMPLKVLIVMPTMGYGGTERQVMELCRGLDRQRFEPTLLVLKDERGYLDAGPASWPCRVERFGLAHTYNFWHLPRLARFIRAGNFDLVHALLPVANFWAGLAAWGGPPLIATSRNVSYPPPRFLFKAADRLAFRRLCRVALSNSMEGKKALCRDFGLDASHVRVILNGIDFEQRLKVTKSPQQMREEMGAPAGARVVATVGRLMEQKGYDDFLRMAAVLAGRRADVFFWVVGDGPDRARLERMSRAAGLDNRVNFLGHRADVPDLLNACDAFVLASRYEGCPNALLEAAGLRVPAVVSDIPAHREVVEDGKTGLLAAAEDAGFFAGAVEKVLDDRAFAAGISEAAWARARRVYGSRRMVAEHEALYERQAARPRRAGLASPSLAAARAESERA